MPAWFMRAMVPTLFASTRNARIAQLSLRAYAGLSFPPHGSFSAMAQRQEAERLHLCAALSSPAAGIDGDFFERPLEVIRERGVWPTFRATLGLDHRRDREFLAGDVILREHAEGSLGC